MTESTELKENEDLQVLAADAIALWGTDSQTAMVVEEAAELIHAVQRFKRSGGSLPDIDHLAEEFADMEIMLEQLRQMLPAPLVERARREKRAKLRDAIERWEGTMKHG